MILKRCTHIILVCGFAHEGHHQGHESTDVSQKTQLSVLFPLGPQTAGQYSRYIVNIHRTGAQTGLCHSAHRRAGCRGGSRASGAGQGSCPAALCPQSGSPGLPAALPAALPPQGPGSLTARHVPPSACGDPQPDALILALTALLASGEDACQADAGSRQPAA